MRKKSLQDAPPYLTVYFLAIQNEDHMTEAQDQNIVPVPSDYDVTDAPTLNTPGNVSNVSVPLACAPTSDQHKGFVLLPGCNFAGCTVNLNMMAQNK